MQDIIMILHRWFFCFTRQYVTGKVKQWDKMWHKAVTRITTHDVPYSVNRSVLFFTASCVTNLLCWSLKWNCLFAFPERSEVRVGCREAPHCCSIKQANLDQSLSQRSLQQQLVLLSFLLISWFTSCGIFVFLPYLVWPIPLPAVFLTCNPAVGLGWVRTAKTATSFHWYTLAAPPHVPLRSFSGRVMHAKVHTIPCRSQLEELVQWQEHEPWPAPRNGNVCERTTILDWTQWSAVVGECFVSLGCDFFCDHFDQQSIIGYVISETSDCWVISSFVFESHYKLNPNPHRHTGVFSHSGWLCCIHII